MKTTFRYSSNFWNIMTCGANCVFTKVLNILVESLAIIQKSFHYCFPFLDFKNPSYSLLQGCLNIFQTHF